ncbi:hypothetical protein [Streptomyces sedi]|uniref:hypothetical protein n=1 Tax=Streptomyces sedi TaxID=555059 RepID=UPI0031ED76FD
MTDWVWPYPFAMPLPGGLLTCDACGAQRDWLFILQLATDQVSVRCRCTRQWHEPRIPADWFRQHFGRIHRYHTDPAARDRALGFDGTFAGIYW